MAHLPANLPQIKYYVTRKQCGAFLIRFPCTIWTPGVENFAIERLWRFFIQRVLATSQTKHHCVLIFSTTLISDIYLELFGYRELRIATAVGAPIRQGIYISFLINVGETGLVDERGWVFF